LRAEIKLWIAIDALAILWIKPCLERETGIYRAVGVREPVRDRFGLVSRLGRGAGIWQQA